MGIPPRRRLVVGMASWLIEKSNGVVLLLYIQPRASKTQVVGTHGEGGTARFKIKVAATPVDGEGNEELIIFLSKKLGIPKSSLIILRGETGRIPDQGRALRRCGSRRSNRGACEVSRSSRPCSSTRMP